MVAHRVQVEGAALSEGDLLEIRGPEAHHALRVCRLGEGDVLEILNGRGCRARAAITGAAKEGRGEWVLFARVEAVAQEPRPTPRVEVLTAAPKGARLEEMIDQLSQVGAARWAPLGTSRAVVSPRTGKLARAERVAHEASKQCGRAWAMEIGEAVSLADAIARPGARLVTAHPGGGSFAHDGSDDILLLIGPEGGFTDDEVRGAELAGAAICGFGRHIMRIETAAVVAAGIVLDTAARYNNR